MKTRRIVYVLGFIVAVAFLFYLAGLALYDPISTNGVSSVVRKWVVWTCVILLMFFIAVLMRGALLATMPQQHTLRRFLADIVHELPQPFKPLASDICHSFFRTPYAGWLAILTTVALAAFAMLWSGPTTWTTVLSFSLGISGLCYGVLSYQVALRVDRSIRTSITDFREFLKVASEILETKIICTGRRVQRFGPIENADDGEGPSACPDLILVLWFPYYGLTRDLNSVGPKSDTDLLKVRGLACRTYLVSSKDPLTLMGYFDAKQYTPGAKKYDVPTLQQMVCAYDSNLSVEDQLRTAWSAHAHDLDDPKVQGVKMCVDRLQSLLSPGDRHYWTVHLRSNAELANELVQIVWTPSRAALVFMPPIETSELSQAALCSTGEDLLTTSQRKSPNIASANEPFKCSGFSTEDPFMISMIRELIKLRYKF